MAKYLLPNIVCRDILSIARIFPIEDEMVQRVDARIDRFTSDLDAQATRASWTPTQIEEQKTGLRAELEQTAKQREIPAESRALQQALERLVGKA